MILLVNFAWTTFNVNEKKTFNGPVVSLDPKEKVR